VAEQISSFNSFSGVDITPVFQGKAIGEIQALSYSIQREKAPVYTMGKADPRSFARGKRGIAGSLIFIVFDRHAILERFKNALFSADKDEFGIRNKVADMPSTAFFGTGAENAADGQGLFTTENDGTGVVTGFNQSDQHPWYSDQIPPFDIVLAAANEYGAQAIMRIYGVEIMNENSGVSIDDIVTEQQYTYIAKWITPWIAEADNLKRTNRIKESIEG
jgi:hypothetical protein